MFVKSTLHTFAAIVIGAAFVKLGLETFGKPLVYARVFIVGLIFAAFFCRKEINVLIAIAIVFASRIIDLAFFGLLDDPTVLAKVIAYPVFGYVIYKTRGILLTVPMYVTLGACIAVEVYWHLIGYEGPQIVWYMFGIALNSLYVFAIDMRLFAVTKFFPGKQQDIAIDTILRWTGMIFIGLSIVMITEYIARHLNLTGSTVVYHSFRYLGHSLSIVVIWAIFHQTYLLRVRKILKA